jgi:hypothetical protein
MKLFLDDNRQPYDVFLKTIDPDYENNREWTIVSNFYEFINFIERNGLPNLISFDHDLDFEHYLPENQTKIDYTNLKSKSGYDCAVWLKDFCKKNGYKLPKFKVHSQNEVGKQNIIDILSQNLS